MRAGTPFHRARLMAAAIAAVMAQASSPLAARDAIASLGPYRSRGHGRGSPLGRGYALTPIHRTLRDPDGAEFVARPVSRSKYVPHQGFRENHRRSVGGYALHRRLHAFYLTEPYSREHS